MGPATPAATESGSRSQEKSGTGLRPLSLTAPQVMCALSRRDRLREAFASQSSDTTVEPVRHLTVYLPVASPLLPLARSGGTDADSHDTVQPYKTFRYAGRMQREGDTYALPYSSHLLEVVDSAEGRQGLFVPVGPCPHGEIGERLFVQEDWWEDTRDYSIAYAATPEWFKIKTEGKLVRATFLGGNPPHPTRDQSLRNLQSHKFWHWRCASDMPEWAARLHATVTDASVVLLGPMRNGYGGADFPDVVHSDVPRSITVGDAMDAAGFYMPQRDGYEDERILGAIGEISAVGDTPLVRLTQFWDAHYGHVFPWASRPLAWRLELTIDGQQLETGEHKGVRYAKEG